jgi:Uma2 family endonuclease
MNLLLRPLPGTVEDPRYPDSNGRFMGETDFHSIATIQIRVGLEDHFADEHDVYIASNLVMYYRQGDARRRRDPDILVAKGVVGKHLRRSFRVWEEGVLPRVLFEIASRRTWRRDVGNKRELYARINIREYFIFDPERVCVKPPLQGFRSVRGQSVPITAAKDGSLISRELGLILRPEGVLLRLIDSATGQAILTRSEQIEAATERAQRINQQNAELAEEIERLRRRIAELES